MATSQAFFIMLVWTAVVLLFVSQAQSVYIPKRAQYPIRDSSLTDPKKRPFCNAFTGCGRKRSNLPALSPRGEAVEESIGSLLELSAEPAVEDLSRQIMSEAKLWEAIQEASMELSRMRQESTEMHNGASIIVNDDDDIAVPAKSATASCALPPCYI